MKPSKVEDVLNLHPCLDESRTLSPLTYYQPFRSSFDPEFAAQSPKEGRRKKCDRGGERKPGGLPGPWGEDPGGPTRRPPPVWNRPCSSRSSLPQGTPPFTGEAPATGPPFPPSPPRSAGAFEGPALGTAAAQGALVQGRSPGFNPFSRTTPRNPYKAGHPRPMICNFCKNNKEVPDIYLNHYLYDPQTKVLTCPVLRKHVCEICGGTGDRAHTLQYCPVNRERGLQAKVPVLLKARTITNSTGKIRKN